LRRCVRKRNDIISQQEVVEADLLGTKENFSGAMKVAGVTSEVETNTSIWSKLSESLPNDDINEQVPKGI
jgi:hypothetical protein